MILCCCRFLHFVSFFLFCIRSLRADFFSGESDDDDFAAASGTPGNSGASGDDQSSGTSYGGSSPMYGSGGIETTGGLGGFGLGASPFSAGALPSLYGAYGAASHPKVKVAPAPPTQKRK